MPEIRISSWNINGIRSYIFNNNPCGKFKKITEIENGSNLHHLLEETNSNVISFGTAFGKCFVHFNSSISIIVSADMGYDFFTIFFTITDMAI